jgi:hypothetical protein
MEALGQDTDSVRDVEADGARLLALTWARELSLDARRKAQRVGQPLTLGLQREQPAMLLL